MYMGGGIGFLGLAWYLYNHNVKTWAYVLGAIGALSLLRGFI